MIYRYIDAVHVCYIYYIYTMLIDGYICFVWMYDTICVYSRYPVSYSLVICIYI